MSNITALYHKKMVLGASLALIASGSVWATNGNSPSPHADMIQSIMQQKTIKGTVVDETGEPIIGANVVEKWNNKWCHHRL